MKVYILFQTDVHKTKSSRVCFSVFSTEEKAIRAAKENDLYSYRSEVEIIECDMINLKNYNPTGENPARYFLS